MNKETNIHKCSQEEWTLAQRDEFLCWGGYNVGDGDDYSKYWMENTNDYQDIKLKHFSNVMEVGCGPFGENLGNIIKLISYDNLYVLDPLLKEYCKNQKSGIYKKCIALNIKGISTSLEKVFDSCHDLINKIDLIICNNVLDHCYDADLCFENMDKLLNNNGYIIFGNDLKDPIDIEIARDSKHPIMLQENYLSKKFEKYFQIFKKVIPRNECRNPSACCGCYFSIYKKQ